jgi:hypothetical protein
MNDFAPLVARMVVTLSHPSLRQSYQGRWNTGRHSATSPIIPIKSDDRAQRELDGLKPSSGDAVCSRGGRSAICAAPSIALSGTPCVSRGPTFVSRGPTFVSRGATSVSRGPTFVSRGPTSVSHDRTSAIRAERPAHESSASMPLPNLTALSRQDGIWLGSDDFSDGERGRLSRTSRRKQSAHAVRPNYGI